MLLSTYPFSSYSFLLSSSYPSLLLHLLSIHLSSTFPSPLFSSSHSHLILLFFFTSFLSSFYPSLLSSSYPSLLSYFFPSFLRFFFSSLIFFFFSFPLSLFLFTIKTIVTPASLGRMYIQIVSWLTNQNMQFATTGAILERIITRRHTHSPFTRSFTHALVNHHNHSSINSLTHPYTHTLI